MDIWLETGVIFNLNHSVNGSRWCFTRKGRWVVLVSPSSCCILAQESRTNIHKRSRKYHNNRCASKCVKGNHYTNMKPRSRCILVLFSVNTNEWAQSWDKNTWSHLDSWRYWRKLKENFILPVFILTEYPAPPPHTHKTATHFPAIRTFPDTGTVPSYHTCLHFTQNNVFILACCYSCCFPCSGLAMDVWDNWIPKKMYSSVSWNLLFAFQFIHKCNKGNERRTSKVKV